MELNISLSKIVGDLNGEKMDTLEFSEMKMMMQDNVE